MNSWFYRSLITDTFNSIDREIFDVEILVKLYNIKSNSRQSKNMSSISSDKEKKKIVLKHYLMKKKLGEGAFGEIYLATNINDNS